MTETKPSPAHAAEAATRDRHSAGISNDANELYDDGEEWSPRAAALDSVRDMPLGSELFAAEPGEPLEYEVAELIGDYVAALLSGYVDDDMFQRAVRQGVATQAQRGEYLAKLRGARRELVGLVLALRDGEPTAVQAQLSAAEAYAQLRAPVDTLGPRRARFVSLLESLAQATADTGTLDYERWSQALVELRELEPALRQLKDEAIWSAYAAAADAHAWATQTAARMSLALDLFGDRARHDSDGEGAPHSAIALAACEKSFALAIQRYPSGKRADTA